MVHKISYLLILIEPNKCFLTNSKSNMSTLPSLLTSLDSNCSLDKLIEFNKQCSFNGGYLFLASTFLYKYNKFRNK